MTIIEKLINSVSVDPQIKDGVFEISNNEHMDVLRTHLIKRGIPESDAMDFCNRVVEGKYPERQAYNKDGLLVTFPTPEYKQRAIQRGTHFEKKPQAQTNLFGEPGATPPADSKPPEGKKEEKPEQPNKTSLPLSSVSAEVPTNASTTSAPDAIPTAPPDQKSEPADEPTELPPPEPKSPEEKTADANAIKSILQSDDSLLQEVATWIENNGPQYILEAIRNYPKS